MVFSPRNTRNSRNALAVQIVQKRIEYCIKSSTRSARTCFLLASGHLFQGSLKIHSSIFSKKFANTALYGIYIDCSDIMLLCESFSGNLADGNAKIDIEIAAADILTLLEQF